MTITVNEQHKANLFLEADAEPTRIRENNEPTVLIFTNEEEMISDLQHLPSIGKSDHLVLAFICYTENIQENINRTRFNFFKGGYQSIKVQLEQTDWDGEMGGLGLGIGILGKVNRVT